MLGLIFLFPFVGLTIARLMDYGENRPIEWTERHVIDKQSYETQSKNNRNS